MKELFLSFIALAAFSGLARAGNEVGGAGIAENNILYAWQNLGTFIDLCLGSPHCLLNDRESNSLVKIRDSLPKERESKEPILFKSGQQHGSFFIVDGLVRIARTGFHVGDPIYINVDLIYPVAAPASIPLLPPPDRPLDIPLAAGVLVHELGHHQGERDHAFLDGLGAKVNSGLRLYGHELDGGPRERELVVTAFEFPGKPGELIARDSTEIRRFGRDVLATFTCKHSTVKAFALWNLHWKGEKPVGGEISLRPMRARAVVTCERSGVAELVDRELDVVFWLKKEDGKSELLPEKTQFREIDCGITPQLCD